MTYKKHHSVDEVNGRLTALEEIDIEHKGISELSRVELSKISSYAFSLEGIADETRTYIVNSYTEITGIHEDTRDIVKQMKGFVPRIENIEKSIKVLAGS